MRIIQKIIWSLTNVQKCKFQYIYRILINRNLWIIHFRIDNDIIGIAKICNDKDFCNKDCTFDNAQPPEPQMETTTHNGANLMSLTTITSFIFFLIAIFVVQL